MKNKDIEVIKVEIPKKLAEKFRKYIAEKYGLRRGSITKAIIDLIEEKLNIIEQYNATDIDSIIGLGLESDYLWNGEDIIEALRRRANVSNRR